MPKGRVATWVHPTRLQSLRLAWGVPAGRPVKTCRRAGRPNERHRLRRAALPLSYRAHVCYTTLLFVTYSKLFIAQERDRFFTHNS